MAKNRKVTYRLANPLELRLLEQLHDEVFVREQGGKHYRPDDYHDGMTYIVAVSSAGEIVGTVGLYPYALVANPQVNISRLVVKKKWRGRGIGSELMRLAHDWAQKNNYPDCVVGVPPGMQPFYRRLGYRLAGMPDIADDGIVYWPFFISFKS